MLGLLAESVALWTLAVLVVVSACRAAARADTPFARFRSGVTAVAVLGWRDCST